MISSSHKTTVAEALEWRRQNGVTDEEWRTMGVLLCDNEPRDIALALVRKPNANCIIAAEHRGMIRAAEIADPSDPDCQRDTSRRARQIAEMIRANAGTEAEPPSMTLHDAASVLREAGWTVTPPKEA